MYKWIAFGILLAVSSTAQVRVYDPSTGKSVEAGKVQNSSTVTIQAVEPEKKEIQPFKEAEPKEVVPLKPTKLGEAFVFISPRYISKNVVSGLLDLQKLSKEGLNLRFYMEGVEFSDYLSIDMDIWGKLPEGLMFTVDNHETLLKEHKIKAYRTIVYHDPFGAKRRYDVVNEFHKLKRHIKRVKRKFEELNQG